MHRSYRIHGAVQIIRYANRLEIRNPGHSLVADDRLGEPGSETRNPLIAAVLHETNLAETKGSGIRVMRELMAQAGLTPPTFESDRHRNRFIPTLLFHHFLSSEDWAWLAHFTELNLSDEEARALVFLRELGAINNARYRDLNRVDVLKASKHLRRLRQHGLVEQKGKGSDTYYIPTQRMLESWPIKPVKPEAKPVKPEAKPVKPANTDVILRDVPMPVRTALAHLQPHAQLSTIQDLAWQLCAWKPLRSIELSNLLGRHRNYVTNSIITPMVRTGRLVMTIPDQPKHPHQRYRATGIPTE